LYADELAKKFQSFRQILDANTLLLKYLIPEKIKKTNENVQTTKLFFSS
jgi:hypothetical protein